MIAALLRTLAPPARRLPGLVALLALATLVALPLPSAAQEDEEEVTTYTRIAHWQVERTRWGDFVDLFEKYDKPVLEKMMADGQITEWGLDAAELHHPEGYTHATWYSADSLGAVMSAGAAYEDAYEALAGAELEQVDADFAAMITKHRDYLIETDGMRAAGGSYDGGYYAGADVEVTRGKDRGFHSWWDHRMVPIFESLMESGAVVSYGLSGEAITTEEPMTHSWWYQTADAAGLDAVDAAFDASWDELDAEGRRARWASIMDVVEEDTYREWMTRVIHAASQAYE